MAEAIAEAEAEGNMHEMEGDGMPFEHEVRTPRMDGLYVLPTGGVERLTANVEGTEARSTIAEEIRRGKHSMTPSQ